MMKGTMKFDKNHIILNNLNHAAGGFGLAILLQNYMVGNPFMPVIIGWILLGIAVIIHVYSWTR